MSVGVVGRARRLQWKRSGPVPLAVPLLPPAGYGTLRRRSPSDWGPSLAAPMHGKRGRLVSFLAELRRRKVYRVGLVYATGGFALLEVADLLLPLLQGPAWTFRAMAAVYLVLLPVVLALAWAYDLTPEGLHRTAEADHTPAHPGVVLPLIFTASIAAGGFLGWRILSTGPQESSAAVLTPGPSVAVLPFVDMSPDGDQEHLADGIAEEILNALTRIEGLKVVARTSAFAFKGRNIDVREVARILGVRHIVEGSVRRDDDRVRITAELVDARDGFHLWSDTFEQPIQSIFAIEDAISRTVADSLRRRMGLPRVL